MKLPVHYHPICGHDPIGETGLAVRVFARLVLGWLKRLATAGRFFMTTVGPLQPVQIHSARRVTIPHPGTTTERPSLSLGFSLRSLSQSSRGAGLAQVNCAV